MKNLKNTILVHWQVLLATVISLTISSIVYAQQAVDADHTASLRNGAINQQHEAPRVSQPINDDVRKTRNYPMQPPTIPHKIDNYQVDVNVNKCMTCHGRRETEDSGAPMVSVTHYMNRDGNFLAEISPRRYFCNQCHVVQNDSKPLVENTYQDVDSILNSSDDQ